MQSLSNEQHFSSATGKHNVNIFIPSWAPASHLATMHRRCECQDDWQKWACHANERLCGSINLASVYMCVCVCATFWIFNSLPFYFYALFYALFLNFLHRLLHPAWRFVSLLYLNVISFCVVCVRFCLSSAFSAMWLTFRRRHGNCVLWSGLLTTVGGWGKRRSSDTVTEIGLCKRFAICFHCALQLLSISLLRANQAFVDSARFFAVIVRIHASNRLLVLT